MLICTKKTSDERLLGLARELNASTHTDYSRNAGSIDSLPPGRLEGSRDTSVVLVSKATMHMSRDSLTSFKIFVPMRSGRGHYFTGMKTQTQTLHVILCPRDLYSWVSISLEGFGEVC